MALASGAPTPVERFDALGGRDASLWVKRDDLVSLLYGGNKVRKLEHLLADARARGKTRLVTLGAAGSHQVIATVIYGALAGFDEVEAVLVPQPSTPHARLNLRVALAQGLHAIPSPTWALAPLILATRFGRDAYPIPLGGSNPFGTLGFVDAARELVAQIAAGVLPEPDVVVVAMGSGGTAAGLAVGFEEAGLRTRVVGVAVSRPALLLGLMSQRLARRTAAMIGLDRKKASRAAMRIEVDGKWIGRGYGYSTRKGDAATADAARVGLVLDATYTAKAFACALARVHDAMNQGDSRCVLYWHTLSTRPLEPLLHTAEGEGYTPIPKRLERLLR